MLKQESIGVLSIATNKYKFYWSSMIKSAAKNLPRDLPITFHLFTDDIPLCHEIVSEFSWLNFQFHPIDSLGWPEATLYRYAIYSQFKNELTEDLLIHLDADMLINSDFTKYLEGTEYQSGIGLVRHPGFFRPSGLNLIKLYLKFPELFFQDIKLRVKVGALGSWESRQASQAYVRRKDRKNYYCGGVWFGSNSAFKKLVEELKLEVQIDSQKGLIAVWHDESHLNSWATRNNHSTLLPELCFDKSYKNLIGLQNVITAVDKNILSE